MSVDGDAIEIVLYDDVLGEGFRHEYHAEKITAHQLDIAEAMGVAHVLVFPRENGVARATALTPYLDRTIEKLAVNRGDFDSADLASRLRNLAHACDRNPWAWVTTRTLKR